MATNAEIQQWFAANPGASNAQIVQVAQANGISPTQIASAMNVPQSAMYAAFNAVNAAPTPAVLPQSPAIAKAPVVNSPVAPTPAPAPAPITTRVSNPAMYTPQGAMPTISLLPQTVSTGQAPIYDSPQQYPSAGGTGAPSPSPAPTPSPSPSPSPAPTATPAAAYDYTKDPTFQSWKAGQEANWNKQLGDATALANQYKGFEEKYNTTLTGLNQANEQANKYRTDYETANAGLNKYKGDYDALTGKYTTLEANYNDANSQIGALRKAQANQVANPTQQPQNGMTAQDPANMQNYNDNRNTAQDQWWSKYLTGRR